MQHKQEDSGSRYRDHNKPTLPGWGDRETHSGLQQPDCKRMIIALGYHRTNHANIISHSTDIGNDFEHLHDTRPTMMKLKRESKKNIFCSPLEISQRRVDAALRGVL